MSIHLQKSFTIQKTGPKGNPLHTSSMQGLGSAAAPQQTCSSFSSARSPTFSLGGLHIFKPSGPTMTLPAKLASSSVHPGGLRIKNSAYEKATSHLTAFAAWFENSISPQGKAPRMAWICEHHAPCAPYPPALQSRGLCLENILFLESASLLQSTQQLCEDDFFDVLILEGHAQPVLLKIAHRWLASHRILPHLARLAPSASHFESSKLWNFSFLKKADELEDALHTRLFLFLE